MSMTPPYPKAPIALAIVEVRGPESPVLTRAEIQALKAALHPRLPFFASEHVQDFAVQLGPGGPGPMNASGRDLTKFLSRNKRTSATYTTTSTIVETTEYRGWTDFKQTVGAAIAARQDIAPMDGLVRLGIRIIDEIRVPDQGSPDWSEWLAPALLAPHVEVGGEPLAVLQQQSVVQYAGSSPGETITVRFGAMDGPPVVSSAPNLVRPHMPDPGPFFLIDTDSAWELTGGDEAPDLISAEVLDRAQHLHAPMKLLFESFITDRLRNEVFA